MALRKQATTNSMKSQQQALQTGPKFKLKLDKADFYQGECVTGKIKLKLRKELHAFGLKLKLLKFENYIIFDP